MPRTRNVDSDPPRKRLPSKTPEGREQELIGLAVEQAEAQLREKSAPTQVVIHYLKLATEREQRERAKLENETVLLQAKVDMIKSAEKSESMYREAIDAMRNYSGKNVDDA